MEKPGCHDKGTEIRVMGGKVLSSKDVEDYNGDLRGISIIESESLDAAVSART